MLASFPGPCARFHFSTAATCREPGDEAITAMHNVMSVQQGSAYIILYQSSLLTGASIALLSMHSYNIGIIQIIDHRDGGGYSYKDLHRNVKASHVSL